MMRTFVITATLIWLGPTALGGGDGIFEVTAGELCSGGAAQAATPIQAAPTLLRGYGVGGFQISTSYPQAQAFFSNGMELGQAFAHKASAAAFVRARLIDPGCAMCWWGEAWARGPTLNYSIPADQQAELVDLVRHAERLSGHASEKEKRLIRALALRYRADEAPKDNDQAYAQAMDDIARQWPRDKELAVLAANALMVTATLYDGPDSGANLPRAMALLEGVLARDPQHTPAIHFYLHATILLDQPKKGEAYAASLKDLAPNASHLVHMPSHTDLRLGRYKAAAAANLDAVGIDRRDAIRTGLSAPGGIWKVPYHIHNVQFGTVAAMLSGDAHAALELSNGMVPIADVVRPDQPFHQLGLATAYMAQATYGVPDKVLRLPEPRPDLPFSRALWRYAQGNAALRKGDLALARAQLARLEVTEADVQPFGGYASEAMAIVKVAHLVLNGHIEMKAGRADLAAPLFQEAARIEESQLGSFVDPPFWWYPARRSLAAAYLSLGRYADATREANQTLVAHVDDPLTLRILAQAATAQAMPTIARRHIQAARRGWKGDIQAIPLDEI